MGTLQFGNLEVKTLSDATAIAEEVVSNYFVMDHGDWARCPFWVSTAGRDPGMLCPKNAFAHLIFLGKDHMHKNFPRDRTHIYHVIINDPMILRWIQRNSTYGLLPLLTYVMTHELVHIARFIRHQCHPVVGEKDQEESYVHEITHNILEPVKMDGLYPILEYFKKAQRRFSHANL